jgi:aquaporin Z
VPADDHPLHGAPVPYNRLHPRLYLAEGAGTALLVFFGLSMVIVFFGEGSGLLRLLPSAAWRRFLAGGCFGTVGALITISPLGRISGAHINPAVSFAFWLEAKLAWRDAFGYVLAQLLGAGLGASALLLWGPMGRSVQYGASLVGPGVSVWTALGGEVLATAALILAIFITAAHARTRRFTPWTLPPLFAWLVWWEGPWSGASTNPARSLGPALLTGQWHQFWIYVLGPLLGAALAVAMLRFELLGQHRVPVARLFHFR